MPSSARAASCSASSRSLLDFVLETHTPSFTTAMCRVGVSDGMSGRGVSDGWGRGGAGALS